MRIGRFGAGMLAGLLLVDSASAGVIEGRVWMSPGLARLAARTPVSKELRAGQRGVTDAVVYIQALPEKVERKLAHPGWFGRKRAAKTVRVIHQNRRVVPRVLAVTAGTRVEFRNLDRVYHNLFSVSAARHFDLGKYAPGHRDTIAFEQPGVANLHCDIHPDEIAYVVVLANHAYDRPDSSGSFRLPKLPAGKYLLRSWHPLRGELSREVEMPKRGNLAIDLTY
jgi:plastocyanin